MLAGASAGGMMPFELVLKGETSTLCMHLAYGVLEESHPSDYSSDLGAGYLQDHHWRLMAHWMTQK